MIVASNTRLSCGFYKPGNSCQKVARIHARIVVTDDFREMEDQGLLTMAFVGDEYLITGTLLGRLWLEQYTTEDSNNAI